METRLLSIIPRLPSRDLAETRHFYSRLGFHQQGGEYPDYLMLVRDEVEIHFFLQRDVVLEQNDGMCYIRVRNLDELFRQFKKALPALSPPTSKPWGQREFAVTDDTFNCLTFGEARP